MPARMNFGAQPSDPRLRRTRRQMVPRFSSEQAGNRPTAQVHAQEPIPVRIQAEPPQPVPMAQEHASHESASAKQPDMKLPELSALMTDLPARIARLDGETLLLLGILWMLWQDKADRRLLLALAYILL